MKVRWLSILIAVAGAGVGATFLTDHAIGQATAPPTPLARLEARVAALEQATVEISYTDCRIAPPNTFFDPRNGENRIAQQVPCGDGEAFRGFVTGVNQPNAEVRFRCCRIRTRIVPRR